MRVIEASHYGGPETLALRQCPTPAPGPGQVRVRVEFAGVNYIDVYQRTGLYPTGEPVKLGLEGAGVVEEVGPEVFDLRAGQRVAWCDVPGSYASHVCAPEQRLVPVPDGVSSELAAAVMLQGMTAHYLAHDTYHLEPGDACLVHAAAGGVGLLLCQMSKRLGARVLGTVSNERKAALAAEAGADACILYKDRDFVAEVRNLTSGRGVQVVYDSVGKQTFDGSLVCLAPRGMLVLFGQSSGPVAPFDPQRLAKGGSLFLTRPTLFHYVASREELLSRASAVLGMVVRGELNVRIDQIFEAEAAAEAHHRLESRASAGKLLLSFAS